MDKFESKRTTLEQELLQSCSDAQRDMIFRLELLVLDHPNLQQYASANNALSSEALLKLYKDLNGNTKHESFQDYYLFFNVCAYFRFLKARKWNVDAALQFMVEFCDWRQRVKPYDVKASDVQDEILTKKCYICGKTKKNYPIAITVPRRHISIKRKVDQCTQFVYYMAEKVVRAMIENNVDKFVMLVDTRKTGLQNMDLLMVKTFISIANMYPETGSKMLIYKPNIVYMQMLKIAKGLLDPQTSNKIEIISKDEDLLKFIEASSIPKEFGGENDYIFNPYLELGVQGLTPAESETDLSHVASNLNEEDVEREMAKLAKEADVGIDVLEGASDDLD